MATKKTIAKKKPTVATKAKAAKAKKATTTKKVKTALKAERAKDDRKPWEKTFKPEYCMVAYELSLLSFGTERIAKVLCVPENHVKEWRNNIDEFRACIQTGKELADGKVAKSLYNRAIGYTHKETKVHFDKLGDVSTHEVNKHIPPDVGACMAWLKIRQKDIWNVADKIEHLGNVAIIAKDEEDL